MGSYDTPLLETPGPMNAQASHILICAGRAGLPCDAANARWAEIGDVLDVGRGSGVGSGARWETSDMLMSRAHLRLRRVDSDRILVRDLGSRNGTYLDGQRLQEGILQDGALLFAGCHVFVYRYMRREDLAAIHAGLWASFGPVPTLSRPMARLLSRLRPLARSNIEILLTGETGVGKEVMAKAIHRESGRTGAFIGVNCAALPEALVESELFGYARGAHSTANRDKPGLVENAAGGTLYLDEVGEMSPTAQAKLLRFLQDGQYMALGATHPHRPDVRIIAATSRSAIAGNGLGLRLDLAYRLGPEPIRIPPLRERVEDIGLLAHHFLAKRPCPLDVHAYRALFLHSWPGNVRELEKSLRRADVIGGALGSIGLGELDLVSGAWPAQGPATIKGPRPVKMLSVDPRPSPPELSILLERHRGNVGLLAREIGRQRTLVWRWLRRAGLDPAHYRPSMKNVRSGTS